MKKILFTLFVLLCISKISLSQILSASATYTTGDISTDQFFYNINQTSTCAGLLTVNIPANAVIMSVDIEYDMTAITGYMSEQRSMIRCLSAGGVSEGHIYNGVGGLGTYHYQRTNLTIANGVTTGGAIQFQMNAGAVYPDASTCTMNVSKVDNNTWKVTVHYLPYGVPYLVGTPDTINMGFCYKDSTSKHKGYRLKGVYLNPASSNIVVKAPANFQISLDSGSNYASTINVPYTGAVLDDSVYVRFLPTIYQNYADSIKDSGGGGKCFVHILGTSLVQYCTTNNHSCYSEKILNVTYNRVNNTTDCSPLGYGNYLNDTAYVYKNVPDIFNTTIKLAGSEYITVWIDWNCNGNFLDPGEEYKVGSFSYGYTVENLKDTIIPPATASEFPITRMRVQMKYGGWGDPCWMNGYGEVEDYSVKVLPEPDCFPATYPHVNSVTSHEAELSWTPGDASFWNIEYGLKGFHQGSGTIIHKISSNPYTLSGLSQATDYDFYIQDSCSELSLGPWMGPTTFCTDTACPKSSNLSTDDETPFTAELDWEPNGSAAFWNIEYGPKNFTPGTGIKKHKLTHPYILTGLDPEIWYDFYVIDSCNEVDLSKLAGPKSFFTDTLCRKPINLGVGTVTTGTALIFWSSQGANVFNIQYGLYGFTPGNGTFIHNVADTFKTLYSLANGTVYQYYVQDSCGAGANSKWAGPFTFSTKCGYKVNTFPWFEGFEEEYFPPLCWDTAIFCTLGTWQHYSYDEHSGDYCAYCPYKSAPQNEMLISPIFDFTNNAKPILDFWIKNAGDDNRHNIFLIASKNGGTTWTDTLWNMRDYPPIPKIWKDIQIDMLQYGGMNNIKLKWDYYGNNGYGVYLDDISIMEGYNLKATKPNGNKTYCDVSEFDTIKMTVKNLGFNRVKAGDTLWGFYNINSGGDVWDSIILQNNFMGGDSLIFKFKTLYDFSSYQLYNYIMGIDYWGDVPNHNDTLKGSINHIPFAFNPWPTDTIKAPQFPYVLQLQPGYDCYHWNHGPCVPDSGYIVYAEGRYYASVTKGENCYGEDSVFIYLAGTGICSIDAIGNIKIFPNPTSGLLNILFSAEVESSFSYKITNIQGRVMIMKDMYDIIPNSAIKIDVSYFPDGVYFIELKNNKSLFINKFILKK